MKRNHAKKTPLVARRSSLVKITLSVLLASVVITTSLSLEHAAHAQTAATHPVGSSPVAPSPPRAISFSLLIIGTRYFTDVDVITKNLKALATMKHFVPVLSSQRHAKFSGRFLGTEEALLADIRSLAADRFEMETRQDVKEGLIITLRKMSAYQPADAR